MQNTNHNGKGGPGLPKLLSVCRWGRRFYAEAADVSQDSQQTLTLQNLELQRALMAEELQKALEPGNWSLPPFIAMVRAIRKDDQAILKLCQSADQETIQAYHSEIARTPPSDRRVMLERHLDKLMEGQARIAALFKAS
jgi:hypothetical protein